jgi:hypothetical protein
MKKIKKSFIKLATNLLKLLGMHYECGTMTLVVDGKKSIRVDLGFTPTEVWINPKNARGIPVCHGGDDAFDRRIVPDGFILIVSLTSEYREVEWIAIK